MATEFERRLQGATLLTAEVLYYMPDHPRLLQTFMWQLLDEAPRYPRLAAFLDHWRREIEAVIRENYDKTFDLVHEAAAEEFRESLRL